MKRSEDVLRRTLPVLIVGGLLVTMPLLLSAAKGNNRTVRANRLEVVGPDGAVRAHLGVVPGGVVGLWMVDQHGEVRATMQVRADGVPSFRLSDDDVGRAEMSLFQGASVLSLLDEEGHPRMVSTVREDGGASLELRDQGGVRIRIVVPVEGEPVVEVVDTGVPGKPPLDGGVRP